MQTWSGTQPGDMSNPFVQERESVLQSALDLQVFDMLGSTTREIYARSRLRQRFLTGIW